jgi:hypothetical protein
MPRACREPSRNGSLRRGTGSCRQTGRSFLDPAAHPTFQGWVALAAPAASLVRCDQGALSWNFASIGAATPGREIFAVML